MQNIDSDFPRNTYPAMSTCSCVESQVDVWTEFFIESVTIPIVSVLGFLGNSGAIIILLRPEMKSTFHQTLVTLAVIENLFLITIITDHLVDPHNQLYIVMLPYFWNPLKNILLCWEMFLIMSISTERYMAVRNPLAYRMQKVKYSPATHLAVYIFPSGFLALVINIPKFLETELVTKEITETDNTTRIVYDYNITSLRLDPDYIFYYIHCTRFIFTGILPFGFLTCMNYLIYKKMREKRSYKINKKKLALHAVQLNSMDQNKVGRKRSLVSYEMRVNIDTRQKAANENQEEIIIDPKTIQGKRIGNSAVTLITVVLVYVILNTPRLILNLVEYMLFSTLHSDNCDCNQTPVWIAVLARISHLFLAINSSINFLIYYSIGRKFKIALDRYRRRRPAKSNTDFSQTMAETEQQDMIPLNSYKKLKTKRRRSASLSSQHRAGIFQRHSDSRKRSYSITLV